MMPSLPALHAMSFSRPYLVSTCGIQPESVTKQRPGGTSVVSTGSVEGHRALLPWNFTEKRGTGLALFFKMRSRAVAELHWGHRHPLISRALSLFSGPNCTYHFLPFPAILCRPSFRNGKPIYNTQMDRIDCVRAPNAFARHT